MHRSKILRTLSIVLAGFLSVTASTAVHAGIMYYPTILSPLTTSNPYAEVADAGDRNNPQIVPTGPHDGFTGDIGGTDMVDAFLFGWGGGSFSAIAAFDTPILIIPTLQVCEGPCVIEVLPLQEMLSLTLLTTDGSVLAGPSMPQIGPINLGAGNYILEVSTSYLVDPPFTIQVIGGPALPFAVPEPGTLALFGLGLAGLGFARRRKAA